jgi:hypothetical protein
MTFEQSWLFAFCVAESEYLLPQARVFWSRMRDHTRISLPPDVFESEFSELFESPDAAVLFSERRPFYFGEILKPSDSRGPDGFIPVVRQHMCTLEVIAIEEPLRLGGMFFQKTNASYRACMQPLFLGRNYRESKRIMTATFTLT